MRKTFAFFVLLGTVQMCSCSISGQKGSSFVQGTGVKTLNFQKTLPENAKGVIFQLQDNFQEGQTYVIVSSTTDVFVVDRKTGIVRVKQGKSLDYEDSSQHSIQLKIKATNIQTNEITQIVLTILVTDINDIAPEFKNEPYPYLTTVSVNTPPNEKVYELFAVDPDTTSDIIYRIDSGSDGRFYISTDNLYVQQLGSTVKIGVIYTQGQGQFEEGREYPLQCVAIDTGVDPPQPTFTTVYVKVGSRPPQFYGDPLHAYIMENNAIDQSLTNEFKVKTVGFQNHPITYELLNPSNTTSSQFSIDPDGTVRALQVLDYESVPRQRRPPIYELKVIATENVSKLKSSAKLLIEVLDDNDNQPVFDLYRYSTTKPEDIPIDTSVLEVKAVDDDSGSNSNLVYSVDHEHFYVETVNRSQNAGIIRVKKRLDYDRLPSHSYSFTVTATDQGIPPASGSANVRVFLTNVNDEPPEIVLEDQKVNVREDSKKGDAVTIIQAADLDNDQVTFYFSPRNEYYEIFQILPTSGLIRLTQNVPSNRDYYVLNITAVDDGSCCGGTVQLSSEAYLNVEIVDINTHKPTFPNCSLYDGVTILENEPPSTQVQRVESFDGDIGENGRVSYAILRPGYQSVFYFNINQDTGDITSNIQFDRESQSHYPITVKGTDQGIPPLEGYCTFTVDIGDVNDNAPKFDLPSYTATISESYEIGHSVITVRADDADIGTNAVITYTMLDSSGYFRIDQDAGIIFLNKTLGSQKSYRLQVMAKDKGSPPLNATAQVNVTVTDLSSQPPKWDSNDYDSRPYKVDENAPVGYLIASFSATSEVQDPDVSFSLMDRDGNSVQSVPPFGIHKRNRTVDLRVFSIMDFNVKNRYELRLRVANHGTIPHISEIHPVVELRDTNNKVPYFRGLDFSTGYYPGSIPENADIGQTVIEIKAYDDDPTSPNNLLFFEIMPKVNVSDKFSIKKIDANTAVLTTLVKFDREETSNLFLDVKVRDGTESSRPNHPPGQPNTAIATVQITITDKNDNPPYFETSYNISVREDVAIHQTVLTVKGKDLDDAAILRYTITAGNVRGAFGIQSKNGHIFVGRQLDYETEQHVYNLEITVSDGMFTNTTTATIHVTDANDNSPVFDKDPYVIVDVVEEDNSITPSNRRLLVTVNATDADINRPTDIRYSLLGFGTSLPNKYFEIEADTGRLYLLTSLDRDLPNGRPAYQFNVRAQDEPDPPPGSPELDRPQFGYTTVQVKPIDINDNAPIFISNLEGSVPEHSLTGTPVMTVVAIDYDEGLNGSVKYEIVEGPSDNSEMKFMIVENSGLIKTNTNAFSFDRETTPTYNVVVKASDRGVNPQSTDADVKINLDDINDQIPVFEKEIYKVNMSEAQKSGPIARVKATDNDIGNNALLDYSLSNHLNHFDVEVANNEGSIVVYRAVDYEDVSQRFFNLTVVVQDPDPTHTATAHVEVTVEDFNDNAPVFVDPRIEVQKYENAPAGTFLAHFVANDADSGINAFFSYSVDRKTDPDHLFNIDKAGNVTVRKMMDREKQDKHKFFILAIDKGDPAQTGTATLVVTLLDVNDNFPIFAEDYRPIVMENADTVPDLVVTVNAIDLDNDPFGAPFGFADPSCTDGSDTCPCTGRPTCGDFSLLFNSSGDSDKGNARVSTKRVFDREKQKFYYMPIVMWDMRGKGDPRAMTGTNTLTIQIGDANDNVHTPGHKDIFVYNYKGMFGPLEIGTVYATDPDDWDVVDKTFTFTGPEHNEKYFSVNKDTGMVTMAQGIPDNKTYSFTVDVYDIVWDVKVECTVSVTVQNIGEEAVFNSGSVRLTGISPEAFVERPQSASNTSRYGDSKYERFRAYIASQAHVPADKVKIVNVQGSTDITDVYLAIQDKNYYRSRDVNALITIYKKSIESFVGVKVDQVPINVCRSANCRNGGCYNSLAVNGKPHLTNTNGTSFVGVDVQLECRSGLYPPADRCTVEFCYNGGTCRISDWGELYCVCQTGFDGPRCQGTHHSFDGRSYALYEPLEQCEECLTSLYIITKDNNGLILYNGPTTDRAPDSEEPTDFMSLELSAGYPRLRIDHGSGALELYVDGRSADEKVKMRELSDGEWHRIDIVRHDQELEMIVDHCEKQLVGQNGTVQDDSMCRKSGVIPGENNFLNVSKMLQLGGRFSTLSYPKDVVDNGFDGCIKNLLHNGMLYDLTVPDNTSYPAGENRCSREEAICRGFSRSGPLCGDNGICEVTWEPNTAKCDCKPGYLGNKCNESSKTKQMGKDSFMQWRLRDYFFNNISPLKLTMNMMFRTQDADGILWTVSNIGYDAFITLQVLNGRLTLTYNLGDGIRNLELYNRFVSNGAWHTTTVDRNGREFILKMDNGEGPNFNFTYGLPNDKQEMQIENTLVVGASVSFTDSQPVLTSDLASTCIRDIRMNNKWFPMEVSDNYKSDAATLSRARNVVDGCVSFDCKPGVCPPGQICVPLWETFKCRCPEYYEKDSTGACVHINYCGGHSCSNGATCVLDRSSPYNYTCLCPLGMTGEFCEHQAEFRFYEPESYVDVLEGRTGFFTSVWVTGNQSNVTYKLENHLDHFQLIRRSYGAVVQIIKPADYENVTERTFKLKIRAEKGTTNKQPVVTARAEVNVFVEDINDNYPVFAHDYRPVVMENTLNFPEIVETIAGKDADSDLHGAPFGFRCADFSACLNFGVTFKPEGDGGRGQAVVETQRVFDREQQKFYYLPILMWDMRGTGDSSSLTGTSTLTIQIGDVNDNKHSPGYKNIVVYNFKGVSFPLDIGTVYAADLDDWDLVDKTFTYVEPKYMENYFYVDDNTGAIKLTRPLPEKKSFTFSVDVRDNFWKMTVRSLVSVTLLNFDLNDVNSAVPVRIKDITAEEFIHRTKASGNITSYDPSKYDEFTKVITDKLSVKDDKISVFSLEPHGTDLDVWISVQGQGRQGGDHLNTTLFEYQTEIENQTGLNISYFNTWTTPVPTGFPVLVNTNATSLVAIHVNSVL